MKRGYEVYSINRINYREWSHVFALHTEGTLNGKSPS